MPDRGGVGLATILFGGEAEVIVCPGLVGVLRHRAFELGLGLRRDDAARRSRKRFAEIRAAIRAVTGVGDGVAVGPDRIIVTAETRQHRRQHGPAAAVGRIFFEMRLDLRHHVVERLIGVRGAGARGQRKIAEPRRSEREVERHRRDRQAHQRHDRGSAAQTKVRPRRQVALAIRGGEQAAADFDTRGLGLGHADQSGGDIAIDLGELILVDHSLAAAGRRRRAAAQRPEHGEDRRDRHQREHKPQRHQAVPGAERRVQASADAPLYTTGGKPGN